MKCPKCGYVSHDYLNACRKCNVDLLGFKAQMQLHVVQAGHIDLRSVLGGVQPSPIASGEFNPGDLFDSPMLVDAQAESGFDISLDDDFSFTPSAMCLESLDGFEVSNIESMQLEPPRSADAAPPPPSAESSDTSYATVMMDTSGLHSDLPPLESASGPMDEPIEIAAPDTGAPLDSADAIIDLPALPLDTPLDDPDITPAELRSSVGRTSDLDLTSMELKRTTRDIEIMNRLKDEALSGDTVMPTFDQLMASGEAAAAVTPEPDSGDDQERLHGPSNPSDTGVINALIDDTPPSLNPTLPEVVPEEDTDHLNQDSGEFILSGLEADFPSIDGAEDTSSSGSSSRNPEDAFTMPDLPEVDATDEPVNPYTEEISLAIDPLAPPAELPMSFPSLQTTILPVSASETPPSPDAVPPVDNASPLESAQPAMEDENGKSADTGSMTTELNLDNSSQLDDAFINATPQETTLSDEQPPPLVAEPSTAMDIHESQPPNTPDNAPLFPDLPEPVEALPLSSHDDPTIVDEPSPFASADYSPAAPTRPPTDAESATVALDISDMQTLDAPVMPELTKPTDAPVPPSHDEPTIVDEPSPFASGGNTPIDFNIAPPHTRYETLEMDIGDAQPFDEPVMPELPELSEPFLHSSHDEPTIVDEPSPFASTSHTPVDASSPPPETPLTDVDVHEINDDDEDLELLFPDDQPPQQRD